MLDLTAGCACGAVTVTLKGQVQSMLLCSCRDCQRATGTGHSSVAMFKAADVSISGPAKSYARTADSGAIFTRHFCPQCGTPLYGSSSRAPDRLLVPAGLFGDAADWFAPNQLIFARSHHGWDVIDPDLPQHERYRDSTSP
ncbi:GFA family protein [Devosia sp.]